MAPCHFFQFNRWYWRLARECACFSGLFSFGSRVHGLVTKFAPWFELNAQTTLCGVFNNALTTIPVASTTAAVSKVLGSAMSSPVKYELRQDPAGVSTGTAKLKAVQAREAGAWIIASPAVNFRTYWMIPLSGWLETWCSSSLGSPFCMWRALQCWSTTPLAAVLGAGDTAATLLITKSPALSAYLA